MSKEYAYKYNNGVLVFGYEDNAYKPYKYYELRRKFERLYGKQELPEIEIYTTTPYIDLETHEVIKTIGYHEKYKLLMMQDFSDLNLEPYENLEEVKQAIDFLTSFIDFVYPTNQEAQNELLAHLICSCSGASLFKRPPLIVSRECSPTYCDMDLVKAVGAVIYCVHTGNDFCPFLCHSGSALIMDLKCFLSSYKTSGVLIVRQIDKAIDFLNEVICDDQYSVRSFRKENLVKRQNKNLIVLVFLNHKKEIKNEAGFSHFRIKCVNEKKIVKYWSFRLNDDIVSVHSYLDHVLEHRKQIIEKGVRLVLWWLKNRDKFAISSTYDKNNEHLYLIRDMLDSLRSIPQS